MTATTPTLLLADGNAAIHRIVGLMFATEDVRVVNVNGGEQAMSRIDAEPPDIVLADVTMANGNGYDVAAFVKGRPDLAHIPVLLLAGALEPVDEARAIAARCDGVLVKPFDPQQVIARVRELIGGAKGHATQSPGGVPRPIDRLIEPRSAPAPPERRDEPPLTLVKQPPAPAGPADDAEEPDWPEPLPVPPPVPIRATTPLLPPVHDLKDDPLADYFDQLDAAFDRPNPGPVGVNRRAVDAEGEGEIDRIDLPTLSSLLGKEPSPPAPKGQILFGAAPLEPPDIRAVPSPQPPRDVPAFRVVEPRPPAADGPWPAAVPSVVVSPAAPAPAAPPPMQIHRSATADAFEALMAADLEDRRAHQLRRPSAVPPSDSQPDPQSDPSPAVSNELVDAVAARVLERLAPDGVDVLISRVVSDVAERLVREEIDRIRGRK